MAKHALLRLRLPRLQFMQNLPETAQARSPAVPLCGGAKAKAKCPVCSDTEQPTHAQTAALQVDAGAASQHLPVRFGARRANVPSKLGVCCQVPLRALSIQRPEPREGARRLLRAAWQPWDSGTLSIGFGRASDHALSIQRPEPREGARRLLRAAWQPWGSGTLSIGFGRASDHAAPGPFKRCARAPARSPAAMQLRCPTTASDMVSELAAAPRSPDWCMQLELDL